MPTFASTARGYRAMWTAARLQDGKKAEAEKVARRIIANRARYETVAQHIGHPELWPLIGALHDREAAGSFAGVLHNGEHIIGTGRKTSLVPAGRGPFSTWENAAVDALTMPGKQWQNIKEWPIERWLYQAEAFNGFGYYGTGVNSPYIWSGTSKQQRGKYVADHEWSSSEWDVQLGIAAVLEALFAIDASLAPKSTPILAPVVAAGAGAIPVIVGSTVTGDPSFAIGAAIALAVIIISHYGDKCMPILTNWKTSLSGLFAVVAAGAHQVYPQIPDLTPIAVLLIGLLSKDYNVSGGTVKQ